MNQPRDRRWNVFELTYMIVCLFACGTITTWCAKRSRPLPTMMVLLGSVVLCYLIWANYGYVINRRRKRRGWASVWRSSRTDDA